MVTHHSLFLQYALYKYIIIIIIIIIIIYVT